jgi:hypothetical protein
VNLSTAELYIKEDNRIMSENILRKIGGQYIAAALQNVPNAETSKIFRKP